MARRVIIPGLAPTATLAPSNSLAPADTIYGGAPITPHQVWLATNTDGSLTDWSTYVEFGEAVTYSYGRSSEFEGTPPGTFTFTLNNLDGRFTPENPTSPLPVKLVEGMQVAWVLGTRIVRGRIATMEIPPDQASWHHLVVTCDDMLAVAGRHSVTSLADGMLEAAGAQLVWRLDEDEDASSSAEAKNDALGAFTLTRSNPGSTSGGVTYGVQQAPGLPGTAVTVSAAAGETNWYGTRHGNTVAMSSVTFPALPAVGSGTVLFGLWNFWIYPNSTINFAMYPKFGSDQAGYNWSAQVQCTPTSFIVKLGSNTGSTYTMTATEQQAPHYVTLLLQTVWQTAGNYWALFGYLYVDNTFRASNTWYDPQHGYTIPTYLGALDPVEVSFAVTTPNGATTPRSGTVQRVSYTPKYGASENRVVVPTLDGRRLVLDSIGTDINTGLWAGALSTVPTGFPDDHDVTLLDVANDIARTEASHVFAYTDGTLSSSVTSIQFRAHDRPSTPAATFDAVLEGSGYPTFIRDITNVATSVEVQGPTQNVTVTDLTIGAGLGRYVTSGQSETILYRDKFDMQMWGQDRLARGKNRAVRTQQFTVDAASVPMDRSTDLLALVPGDRLRIAGLPAARLGFATWDGFLLGASESHTPTSNSFTFQLTTATPVPAVLDTSRYAGNTDVRLGNPYTATATSWVLNTSGPLTLSTDVPYTLQVDQEQITVTAVSGSTVTVTRGANGTTAASHTVNTVVDIVPDSVYAY